MAKNFGEVKLAETLKSMHSEHGPYIIDDDIARVDFARVHHWLTNSYWSPGISRELVEKAARGSSLVIACYHGEVQVGYTRIVSDRATFAWVSDVFVDEVHRGKGIARAMTAHALRHPEHQGLRRWCLTTKNAHDVYATLGFKPLIQPERWMCIQNAPLG